jgi:hypothetical protein
VTLRAADCARPFRFLSSAVKKIVDVVLEAELTGKEYEQEDAKEWSINICENIKKRVKEECHIPRYKIIVQVTTGEMKDQGARVASRSLWDTQTDNYASSSFQNQSLWCCAMVFGVYTD